MGCVVMAKSKLTRLPANKAKRYKTLATNGPWDGCMLMMPPEGTMVFKLGDFHGRYKRSGTWENV